MPDSERIDRCTLLVGVSVCISLQSAGGEEVLPQAESTAPALSQASSVARSAELYEQWFAAQNYSEATEAAKLLVTDVIASDAGDLAYADALQKLARAQHLSGDLTAAISNYRSAVQRIESAEDMLAAGLVEPLAGLASALAEDFQFSEARAGYERAAHITRVNEGPMNLAQCDILADLADLHAQQSSYDAAVDLLAYQLNIYRRTLEETDPKVLTSWRRNGQMLSLSGRHHDAQEHYRYAMDNIRVADGANSLAQLPLLYNLSKSYLHHANADKFTRIEMARAELERAVLIAERNPDASSRQRFDANLRMGDFMQRFGQSNSALNHYRRAWQEVVDNEELRSATFGTPAVLTPPAVLQESGPPRQPDVTAVRVSYDVDKRGHVENARVEESNVANAAAKKALMLTRKLIFRPRFDAGEPVMTPGLVREITVPSLAEAQ